MNILQRVQAAKSEAAALGHEMGPFVYRRRMGGVYAVSSCTGCGAEIEIPTDQEWDQSPSEALVHECLNPKKDVPDGWKRINTQAGPLGINPFQGLPGMNAAHHPHGIAPLSTTREG